MTGPELHVAGDLAAEAAATIAAIAPRTLALAGGGTPRATYEHLATARLDWSGVEVFFGDERCVPPDHADSNFRMADDVLLRHVPARIHRMPGERCDADAYERELAIVFGEGIPVFDLVILGLGDDGHTASLFPGDRVLEERRRTVARVERPDHPRLTLTLPVLSAARIALFLVAGAGKREALQRLLAGDRGIPAARVEARRVIVYADRDAAP